MMTLFLNIQMRSIGYGAFNDVSNALHGITSETSLVAVAADAATLALAGLAAVAAGFTGLALAAGDYNKVITQTANNAGMTDAQMQQMSDTVLNLSKNTGLATTDLATGYMHISDEGFKAADATQVATAAAESAASTGAKFSDVANLLATTLHIWGLNADQAASTMDTLHVASALSNVTLDQFVAGLAKVEPIAAAAGIGIDETSAALATMTRNGFTASTAATQLRSFIQHIIAPTAGAERAIVALSQATGVDLVRDFSQTGLAVRGFTGVVEDIATATKGDINAFADLTGEQRLNAEQTKLVTSALGGNLQAMQDMVPATRGLYAEFILTGSGANDYVGILKQMAAAHEDGGITAQNFARWEQTLGAQMEILKANVHVAAVEVGQTFAPIIQQVVSFLISDAIPAFEMLATWIGSHFIDLLDAAKGAWNSLVAAFNGGGLLGVVQSIITALINFATNMYNAGVNLVEQLAQGMWNAAVTIVQTVINDIAQMIANFFVGNSPPPQGPLSKIDQGGKNTMTAWVGGAQQGLGGLQQVADSASYTLSSIGNKANFIQLTNDATQAKLAVIGLKDAGAEATLSLQAAKDKVHEMTDEITKLKNNIQETKDKWATMIDPLQTQADSLKFDIQNIHDQYASLDEPLQTQLDDLKQAVDYNQKIADAQDQIALAQLNNNIAADQGNQLQKAQYEQQLASVRERANELSIEAQIADLKNKKTAAAGDPAKLQSLDLKLQELGIQKQIYDLANHPQLATDQAAKVALEEKIRQQKAAENLAALQQKQQEAVLEKQISDNKKAEAAKTLQDRIALAQVEGQIAAYKLNEKQDLLVPEAQLRNLQDQKQYLSDQVQSLTDAKVQIGAATTMASGLASQLGLAAGAAKGIGGGLGGFPKKPAAPPNLGDSFDPNAIAAALAAKAKTAIETATADAVSKAQAAASKAITTWADGIAAQIQLKKAQIGAAFFNFANGGYKGFVDFLNQHLPMLGQTISTGISANLPAVEKALGDLFNAAYAKVAPAVGKIFSNLGTSISKAIGVDNMEIIHAAADGFKDIGARVQAVVTLLTPLATGITTVGVGIATNILPAMQSFAQFLGDAFSKAVDLISWFQHNQEALDAVKSVLLAIVGIAFSAFIWAAVGALAAVTVATWAWVTALAAAAVAFAIANAPLILIGLAIAGVIFAIMELVRHHDDIGNFFSFLGSQAQLAKQAVGDAFDAFGANIKSNLDTIGASIGEFWRNAGQTFNTALTNIGAAVGQAFSDLGTAFSTNFQSLTTAVGQFWSGVGTNFHDALEAVKITVGQKFSDLGTLFQTGLAALVQKVTDNIQYFKTAISNFLQAGKQLITDDLSKWADIGKNIVDAVAGGIHDAAKAVADAAGQMVSDAVSAAKSALGIKSPSTVFLDIGHNTGEGFARGLEASKNRVAAATGNMLSIPGSAGMASSAIANRGANGGGVTVLISGNYILDDMAIRELADKVGQAITRSTGNAQFLARIQ
jgi:TP901 family phage tail tape measure protein